MTARRTDLDPRRVRRDNPRRRDLAGTDRRPEGKPSPTERFVRVADAALEDDPTDGVRRLGLSTPLTTAADATDVAERVLARTRTPQGRIDGMTWDLGLFPPAGRPNMAAALDLLDGTIRIGRGLIVDNADLWPDGGPIGRVPGRRPYTSTTAPGRWV